MRDCRAGLALVREAYFSRLFSSTLRLHSLASDTPLGSLTSLPGSLLCRSARSSAACVEPLTWRDLQKRNTTKDELYDQDVTGARWRNIAWR